VTPLKNDWESLVYALEKFRICIYGHEVYLYTDNKALTFLSRCALTSSRIARWMMLLQEYDLHIRHTSRTAIFLADTISRNPAGLSESDIKELTKPRGIMIAATVLCVDASVGRDLRDLAAFQARDPKIQKTVEKVKQLPEQLDGRYLIRHNVLYSKDSENYPYWRPVLPTELESQVIRFVHMSLGHLGTEKCMAQIDNTFHVRSLGRKVRRLISRCDVCQRVKHPNRSYATECRSHLPAAPGDLCATDLYGPLPVGRGGVLYILVLLDVFSKYVKLYPLRAATTRACLNKVTGHYINQVTKPKCVLSDNGTQFASPTWRKRLAELDISDFHLTTPPGKPQRALYEGDR
jgi:hypothetical protein